MANTVASITPKMTMISITASYPRTASMARMVTGPTVASSKHRVRIAEFVRGSDPRRFVAHAKRLGKVMPTKRPAQTNP